MSLGVRLRLGLWGCDMGFSKKGDNMVVRSRWYIGIFSCSSILVSPLKSLVWYGISVSYIKHNDLILGSLLSQITPFCCFLWIGYTEIMTENMYTRCYIHCSRGNGIMIRCLGIVWIEKGVHNQDTYLTSPDIGVNEWDMSSLCHIGLLSLRDTFSVAKQGTLGAKAHIELFSNTQRDRTLGTIIQGHRIVLFAIPRAD